MSKNLKSIGTKMTFQGLISSKKVLFETSKYGSVKILKALIEGGVDVNAKRSNWFYDGSTALHIAARNDKHEFIQVLLDNNADVNACDAYGNTALHYAVHFGNPNAAEMLLKHPKTDKHAKDIVGKTPFMCAVRYRNINMIKLFKKYSVVDFTVRDNSSNTALHHAVSG